MQNFYEAAMAAKKAAIKEGSDDWVSKLPEPYRTEMRAVIEEELILLLAKETAEKRRVELLAMSESRLFVGDLIEHDRFGIGRVVLVQGEGDKARARVNFGGDTGEKDFLTKYAPYTKL